jgi:hypothetical protein
VRQRGVWGRVGGLGLGFRVGFRVAAESIEDVEGVKKD